MAAPSRTWANLSSLQKDAYYARRRKYRKNKSVGKFVAIDGEAFTVGDRHYYAMIGASTGDYIYREDGLTTFDCVNFLLNLKKKTRGNKYIGFAFNYDVNMIVGDLSEPELLRLWHTGSVTIRLDDGAMYRMEWLPGKSFLIIRMYDKLSIEICDSFGFFQSSFIKALESWKVEDPDGAIARMKGERSNFGPEDSEEVLAYCLSECRLLVELMLKLEAALIQANLRPAKWNGAGAVAAALLQRERVHSHKVNDEDFPEPVTEAIMRAYFGGRVEVFLQGHIPEVTNYDIRSAYPFEALHLPSLHGQWKREQSYNAHPYALWLCKWDIPAERNVMPFPYRQKKAITYPSGGMGWYHAKEVANAMRYYSEYIEVLDGWTFHPILIHERPFSFIRPVFAERAEAKRQGLASEKALKLGLNSLYGKTAQGVGYKGKVPRFRSFFWAGMITAGTRGRLLDLACKAPNHCVSVATDGIVFTKDPGFELSEELGGLERTEWTDFFIAQPGIYRGMDVDGKEFKKSRGFFLKEIDFPDLIEGWNKVGPYYKQTKPTRRFIGIGSALNTGNLAAWRTWPDGERTLSLYTSRKFYAYETIAKIMRLLPPHYSNPELSDIYVPKSRGVETDDVADPLFVGGMEQPTLDL